MKTKFRWLYLEDLSGEFNLTVAHIQGEYYSVVGNSCSLLIKDMKKDWGKKSKWGKYINE